MMGLAATMIRRHYKHMFRTIGIMSLPLILAASTLYYLATTNMVESLQANPFVRTNPLAGMFGGNFLLSMLAYYMTYITILWGSVYYLKLYDEKGPENFQWNDIWNLVFRHGWKLIFSNILIFILLIVFFFILALIFGLFAQIASFFAFFVFLLYPIMFGIMAFIFIWQVTYLYEACGLFDAFAKAIALVKGQFWKSIGLLIASFVATYGILLTPLMITILFSLLEGSYGHVNPLAMMGSMNIWSLIFQNLTTVFTYISMYFISLSFMAFYLSNRERISYVSLGRKVEKLADDQEVNAYS